MTLKLLPACSALLLWLWPWPSAAQTLRYDLYFKHSAELYAPWEDWHYFKAQGIAESDLNQAARGSQGDTGIMQLMPATARMLGVDATDAEQNIAGGIKYDASLYRAWTAARSVSDRRALMFASYNAGLGNIQKAAKQSAPLWDAVAKALPGITGPRAAVTTRYVASIARNYLICLGSAR